MDTIKKVAQAYLDMLEAKKKKTDEVDPNELKKDFDDREDKDIDNDGDTDKSDEYLHNRRKTVKKAMGDDDKKGVEEGVQEAKNTNTYNNLPNKINNTLRHDADRSGDTYAGKHGEKYSQTHIKVGTKGLDAIHKAVKSQNPHISSSEHQSLAAAIHKDQRANMKESFSDHSGYEVKGWEVVQENEDGTFDAFINGELYMNLDEEKAKELKHSNIQQKNPEGQEKLEPRAKGEKDFKDQHTVDKKDEEQTVGVDTKGMDGGVKKAPARTGDKAQAETMQSVPKTTGQ